MLQFCERQKFSINSFLNRSEKLENARAGASLYAHIVLHALLPSESDKSAEMISVSRIFQRDTDFNLGHPLQYAQLLRRRAHIGLSSARAGLKAHVKSS